MMDVIAFFIVYSLILAGASFYRGYIHGSYRRTKLCDTEPMIKAVREAEAIILERL